MIKPDYERMQLIYRIALEEDAGNIEMLLTVAHIKTNGFTFLNRGLFNELPELNNNSDDIKNIIRNSINLWNSCVILPCNIDIASEMIVTGSQYTDTHIRNIVYKFYKDLLNIED